MVNAELGTTWCEKLSIVAMKKHALMKKQINEKIYLTVAILKNKQKRNKDYFLHKKA